MVDVVTNHFGAPGPASSINYAYLHPFDEQDRFHSICWITDQDYASHDQAMIDCWIGNEDYPCPDGWLSHAVGSFSRV